MDLPRFCETLRCLREELKDLDQVQEEDREILICLSKDIERFLDRSHEGNIDSWKDEGFFASFKGTLIGLEQAHPKLTAAIQQVSNALSDLGI